MRITPVGTKLDRLAECWEELDDLRTGNAAPHELHEQLTNASCAVLWGGRSAVGVGLFARAWEAYLRGFLALANGLPSHGAFSLYSVNAIRNSGEPSFSGSCRNFRFNVRSLSRSTANCRVARSTRPAANRPCIGSAPGAASNAWRWRKSPPTRNRTRSPPRPISWRCCRRRERS